MEKSFKSAECLRRFKIRSLMMTANRPVYLHYEAMLLIALS